MSYLTCTPLPPLHQQGLHSRPAPSQLMKTLFAAMFWMMPLLTVLLLLWKHLSEQSTKLQNILRAKCKGIPPPPLLFLGPSLLLTSAIQLPIHGSNKRMSSNLCRCTENHIQFSNPESSKKSAEEEHLPSIHRMHQLQHRILALYPKHCEGRDVLQPK